jgi:hypothetical protein
MSTGSLFQDGLLAFGIRHAWPRTHLLSRGSRAVLHGFENAYNDFFPFELNMLALHSQPSIMAIGYELCEPPGCTFGTTCNQFCYTILISP